MSRVLQSVKVVQSDKGRLKILGSHGLLQTPTVLNRYAWGPANLHFAVCTCLSTVNQSIIRNDRPPTEVCGREAPLLFHSNLTFPPSVGPRLQGLHPMTRRLHQWSPSFLTFPSPPLLVGFCSMEEHPEGVRAS
jgi:hypothetical protein